jgi:hypothetical protein
VKEIIFSFDLFLFSTFTLGIFVTSFDVLRYVTGPFDSYFCHFQFISKAAIRYMVVLHFDLIFICRYILILWLKNPIAVKDKFWGLFLGLWVTFASTIIDFTRYSLPGKEAFAFYICTGIDSIPDKDLPNKPTSFIEILSMIIVTLIMIRILLHKKKHSKISQQIHPNIINKINDLTHIEQSTIADMSLQFFLSWVFVLYLMVLIRLRTSSPKEINAYPNYLFIYLHQIIFPQLLAFTGGISYYLRHPPLMKATKREMKEIFENFILCIKNARY